MNAITMLHTQLHEGAWVHIFSEGGDLDYGYGQYKGQVLREDADESLRFDAAEVRVSRLTEGERKELARSPEQLMCKRITTARIELTTGKVVYGHCVWWHVAADEASVH